MTDPTLTPTDQSFNTPTHRYKASSLPPHIEWLTCQPWSPERSRQVDHWLWYQQEEQLELMGVGQ